MLPTAKRAKVLLEQSHNVTEVARAMVFADSTYFGRVFRLKVGISPGSYLSAERAAL